MRSKHCECLYHVTPTRNLATIGVEGLVPQLGPRAREAGEVQPFVHCFTSFHDLERAWPHLAERFPRAQSLTLLAISLSPHGAPSGECAYAVTLSPSLLWVAAIDLQRESDISALRDRECDFIADYLAAAAPLQSAVEPARG